MTVGVLLAAAALASCGESKPQRPPCPAGKACLHFGNVSDPISLDPPLTTGTWESQVLGDMMVGLTTEDAAGTPIPGMAERWTTSADGRTWTFHLREAEWSDGVPVTADDFVYALRRTLDPETASEYAYLLYYIAGAQAVNEGKAPLETLGVRAIDARTLEMRLVQPAPYLPELLNHQTAYPVPKHVVEKLGMAWSRAGNYVSNGPYVLQDWRLGDRVRVVKNPRFYDADKVCFDEVSYYPTRDSVSAERRVRRGELDLNNDIQSNRIAYLRRPDQMPAYVHVHTYLGVTYLAFNTRDVPALKDRRVRQALAMAVDRDFITRKLLRGGQSPAWSMVPPGTANYAFGAAPHRGAAAAGRGGLWPGQPPEAGAEAPGVGGPQPVGARRAGRLARHWRQRHPAGQRGADRLRRLPHPRLPDRRRRLDRRLQRRQEFPRFAARRHGRAELWRLQEPRL
jgi:oligopeptide transport system substrate-binding protein